MVELILKKRAGESHLKAEIDFLISQYVNGFIPDYQMSAWLMAVWFRGMTEEETANLTSAMVNSGEVVDLSSISGIKVDKHSTGGVGDTTTLILAPLVAAAGVPVAKMSGRGLGFTGGTLDKLESIPGFKVELSKEEFVEQVNRIGIAVIAQTTHLVPADKLLYTLRDVTGTIDSLPLIASSIMSKKLASGCDAIVLDVKFGSGAFMKELAGAKALAGLMVKIGEMAGKRTIAVLSGMDEPLGNMIGNALEVREAIEVLRGERGGALRDVALTLGAYMLVVSGKADRPEQGEERLIRLIRSGEGVRKFKEFVKAQGGNPLVADDLNLLPQASTVIPVESKEKGIVSAINAEMIGKAALELGAGRKIKSDTVDHAVGVVLNKRVGEAVLYGEPLAFLHANSEDRLNEATKKIYQAFTIGSEPASPLPLISEVIE